MAGDFLNYIQMQKKLYPHGYWYIKLWFSHRTESLLEGDENVTAISNHPLNSGKHMGNISISKAHLYALFDQHFN